MPINSQNKKQTKKYQINRKSRGGAPSKSKKKVRFSLPTQRSYAGIDGKPVSMKSRSSSKKYTTPLSRNSSIQQSIDRWNKQDKINREAKEKGVTPRALASVPLSIPGFKSRSELYNWKEENFLKNGRAVKALREEKYAKLRKDNPGQDIRRYVGGFHTEALAYGFSIGIIVEKGFEDYAIIARERYAHHKIMPSFAPFFQYEKNPHTGNYTLRHLPDEDVYSGLSEAQIAHLIDYYFHSLGTPD